MREQRGNRTMMERASHTFVQEPCPNRMPQPTIPIYRYRDHLIVMDQASTISCENNTLPLLSHSHNIHLQASKRVCHSSSHRTTHITQQRCCEIRVSSSARLMHPPTL